jgi:hypothetical protein
VDNIASLVVSRYKSTIVSSRCHRDVKVIAAKARNRPRTRHVCPSEEQFKKVKFQLKKSIWKGEPERVKFCRVRRKKSNCLGW